MHLLTLQNLSSDDIMSLIDLGLKYATDGIPYVEHFKQDVVGIYFRGNSTRTRTSFSTAALKLGANIIYYGPNELQLNTGETAQDTARVLSEYLSAFVVRTNGADEELMEFATQDKMSVINAMSESEHPTQAIADMIAIKEAFGQLKGCHILYLGEGNNTAAALAYMTAKIPGLKLSLMTPADYAMNPDILQHAQSLAGSHSEITEYHDMSEVPLAVDVVYTTRWETMGVTHEKENWRDSFWPFQVNEALMQKVSRADGKTVFMHDLPAIREQDVTNEVLDGPQSIAFRQAHHKLSAAAAVLYTALSKK